jgi:hypothetical protein
MVLLGLTVIFLFDVNFGFVWALGSELLGVDSLCIVYCVFYILRHDAPRRIYIHRFDLSYWVC